MKISEIRIALLLINTFMPSQVTALVVENGRNALHVGVPALQISKITAKSMIITLCDHWQSQIFSRVFFLFSFCVCLTV